MKRILLLLSLLYLSGLVYSQTAPPTDLVTIEQNFKKLNVLGSVLYVAAHPDDENTRLLAYLAQEKHYRTGYLSLTRGDGGQNLIGTEQGELLGLIRTQETFSCKNELMAPSSFLPVRMTLVFQKGRRKRSGSGIRKKYWAMWCG